MLSEIHSPHSLVSQCLQPWKSIRIFDGRGMECDDDLSRLCCAAWADAIGRGAVLGVARTAICTRPITGGAAAYRRTAPSASRSGGDDVPSRVAGWQETRY
jgi:hypothetical protein